MTPKQFINRLDKLKLTTATAAKELRVSRFAIMHWKAKRRPIPGMVEVALEGVELKRRLNVDFLG